MQYVGIGVRRGSGITSLREVAETRPSLRVMTLVRGVTGEKAASQIFEAYGFTYDDIIAWGGSVEHTDFEVIANAVRDGRVDIFIQSIARGHPVFTELAIAGKIDILGVSDEAIDFMVERYGYSRGILPAGSFAGQDEDLNLPFSTTGLSTTDKMDDEMAYKITKAIVENKEMLITGHRAFEDFDPEQAWAPQIIGGMQLHPGAERYFRERGMIQ
jgi:TRAP transporter TAXI family solute receptor